MAGKLSIELLLSAVAVKNQFEGVAETFEDEEAKKEALKQIENIDKLFWLFLADSTAEKVHQDVEAGRLEFSEAGRTMVKTIDEYAKMFFGDETFANSLMDEYKASEWYEEV